LLKTISNRSGAGERHRTAQVSFGHSPLELRVSPDFRAYHGRDVPRTLQTICAPVNTVGLIGLVVNGPELTIDREGRDECFMQLEVPRRDPSGNPVPGVIYVDVTTFGVQARFCAERLTTGQRIGVAGSLERDDSLDGRGPRRSRWEVHAHQIELIDARLPSG
jgi:hypothetical protein